MRRLRIGDKILRVRDEPEPAPDPRRSPTPLFCVHGAGMSSVVWRELVRRLPPARRVIAPDLPAHGQSSPWHAEAPTIEGYRDAVGTVCAHLKVARAVLVGHSMGGAIALSCALAWPERVAGLVLVNSAAALSVSDEVLEMLARTLPSEAAAAEAEKVWADRMPDELAELSFSPATHKDVRERWQAVLFAASRQTVLGDFQACRAFDVRERLGALKLPTLIIGGSDDLLVPPALLTATAEKIAGAQLHLVPHTAHLTHLEQPDKFLEILSEFLRGVP